MTKRIDPTATYEIVDGQGNFCTACVEGRHVMASAQEYADELGASVFVSLRGDDDTIEVEPTSELEMMAVENQNGRPSVGDIAQDSASGDLYRVTGTIGGILTGQPGRGNCLRVTVEHADWDDVPEGEDNSLCSVRPIEDLDDLEIG